MAEEGQYIVEYTDDNPEETNWLKREGQAKITYSNGDTFEGEINAEKLKHGKGKYVWVQAGDDGNVELASYEGEYVSGKKEGLGKMKFPNGDTYHGIWCNDIINGEGSYIYSNGDIFSGSFVNGIKQGNGTYEYAADKSQLVGTWEKGTIVDGTWIFKDGGKYVGHFDNGKPIGTGLFTFANGLQQEGEYVKGSPEDGEAEIYTWTGGIITKTQAS